MLLKLMYVSLLIRRWG